MRHSSSRIDRKQGVIDLKVRLPTTKRPATTSYSSYSNYTWEKEAVLRDVPLYGDLIAEFGANVDGTHDSQHNARFNLSTKHIAVNVTDIGANGGTKRCANAIRAAAGRSTRDGALFRCTTPAVWEWSALLRRIRICCRCAWVRLENARACASPIAAG